jgi:hypothetical protein
MATNLTSVAGDVFMDAWDAAAADSAAFMPEDETALCEPAFTVDFSTCVALDVRR